MISATAWITLFCLSQIICQKVQLVLYQKLPLYGTELRAAKTINTVFPYHGIENLLKPYNVLFLKICIYGWTDEERLPDNPVASVSFPNSQNVTFALPSIEGGRYIPVIDIYYTSKTDIKSEIRIIRLRRAAFNVDSAIIHSPIKEYLFSYSEELEFTIATNESRPIVKVELSKVFSVGSIDGKFANIHWSAEQEDFPTLTLSGRQTGRVNSSLIYTYRCKFYDRPRHTLLGDAFKISIFTMKEGASGERVTSRIYRLKNSPEPRNNNFITGLPLINVPSKFVAFNHQFNWGKDFEFGIHDDVFLSVHPGCFASQAMENSIIRCEDSKVHSDIQSIIYSYMLYRKKHEPLNVCFRLWTTRGSTIDRTLMSQTFTLTDVINQEDTELAIDKEEQTWAFTLFSRMGISAKRWTLLIFCGDTEVISSRKETELITMEGLFSLEFSFDPRRLSFCNRKDISYKIGYRMLFNDFNVIYQSKIE